MSNLFEFNLICEAFAISANENNIEMIELNFLLARSHENNSLHKATECPEQTVINTVHGMTNLAWKCNGFVYECSLLIRVTASVTSKQFQVL